MNKKKLLASITVLCIAMFSLCFLLVGCGESKSSDNNFKDSSNKESTSKNANELKVGDSITLKDDLEVTVLSVDTGLKDYSGNTATKIDVKYVNNGNKKQSYNFLDWKIEDASGAQTNNIALVTSKDSKELSSGDLAAGGGNVTGSLYLSGTPVKILYFSNLFNDDPAATWLL